MSRSSPSAPAWVRALLWAVVWAIGALTMVIGSAGPAWAHAGIESTTPANRAVLPDQPSELVLRFNEPVTTDLGGVRVIGPGGNRVDSGRLANDGATVRVPVSSEVEGTHLVSWRVVSVDGHAVSGAFVYSVGVETGSPAPPQDLTATENVGLAVGLAIARFVGFAAMCVLLGGAVFIGWLWPEGSQRLRVRSLFGWSWTAAFVASTAALLLYGPHTAGLGPEAALRVPLLLHAVSTPTGEALAVRLGALLLAGVVLAGIGMRTSRGRRPRRWQGPLLLAVLTIALIGWSRGGHAGAAGPLYMLNMALHFAAVALWLGGLVLLAVCLRSTRDGAELAGPLAGWSKLTALSVAVITVTGVVSAVREVEVAEALWNTTYGRLLAFKVGLVALMLVLGNAGRLWIRRRARTTAAAADPTNGDEWGDPEEVARRDVAALRHNTAAETVIAVMVLVVTTVLVETLPAKDAFAPPHSEVQRIGALNLQVDVEPARVGPNAMHLYVTDETGRPVDVPEISGRLRLPDSDTGPLRLQIRRVAAGHYEAVDLVIPVAGRWVLDASVRTTDIDESTTRQTIRVR